MTQTISSGPGWGDLCAFSSICELFQTCFEGKYHLLFDRRINDFRYSNFTTTSRRTTTTINPNGLRNFNRTPTRLNVGIMTYLFRRTLNRNNVHAHQKGRRRLVGKVLTRTKRNNAIFFLNLDHRTTFRHKRRNLNSFFLYRASSDTRITRLNRIRSTRRNGNLLQNTTNVRRRRQTLKRSPSTTTILRDNRAFRGNFVKSIVTLFTRNRNRLRHGNNATHHIATRRNRQRNVTTVIRATNRLFNFRRNSIVKIQRSRLAVYLANNRSRLASRDLKLLEHNSTSTTLTRSANHRYNKTLR